jgi:hypothetical protein
MSEPGGAPATGTRSSRRHYVSDISLQLAPRFQFPASYPQR